jgi:hypothetical protein
VLLQPDIFPYALCSGKVGYPSFLLCLQNQTYEHVFIFISVCLGRSIALLTQILKVKSENSNPDGVVHPGSACVLHACGPERPAFPGMSFTNHVRLLKGWSTRFFETACIACMYSFRLAFSSIMCHNSG